jgi:hypothetical protein
MLMMTLMTYCGNIGSLLDRERERERGANIQSYDLIDIRLAEPDLTPTFNIADARKDVPDNCNIHVKVQTTHFISSAPPSPHGFPKNSLFLGRMNQRYKIHLPVTLRLRMEKVAPDMEGSCEYNE